MVFFILNKKKGLITNIFITQNEKGKLDDKIKKF